MPLQPACLPAQGPCCLQAEYNLAYLDNITVINRQDCCQDRIMCYQLELMDASSTLLATYPFTTFTSSYVFRSPTDPAFAESCNLPPTPAAAAAAAAAARVAPRAHTRRLLQTVVCPAAVGKLVRHVKFVWVGGCSQAADGYLHAFELQYNQGGTNVALSKTTTSSGSYGAIYEAGNMVDGNMSTMYHSSTFGSSVYWSVDLGVGCCCCCLCCCCLCCCCLPMTFAAKPAFRGIWPHLAARHTCAASLASEAAVSKPLVHARCMLHSRLYCRQPALHLHDHARPCPPLLGSSTPWSIIHASSRCPLTLGAVQACRPPYKHMLSPQVPCAPGLDLPNGPHLTAAAILQP
jgi:hypothetical protein